MSWLEVVTSIELGLIFGIAAIGVYLTFRVLDFPDLTCDGSFVLGGATAAMLLKAGCNPVLAIIIAAIAGGLSGFGTGVLHVYFKMTNLLSGILMAFMLYSINLKVMHGVPNIALFDTPSIFDNGELLVLGGCAVGIWALFSFILCTDFGLGLRTVGKNKCLAANCGINISLMTVTALIMSNALIGVAGALCVQHQGFADISQGIGTIIICLASVMIGEKLLTKRNIWVSLAACVVGSIAYRLLVAAALHNEWLGLETQDLNLITGVMVVIIMVMPKMNRTTQHA